MGRYTWINADLGQVIAFSGPWLRWSLRADTYLLLVPKGSLNTGKVILLPDWEGTRQISQASLGFPSLPSEKWA